MAQNPQPTVVFPSSPDLTYNTMSQQPWTFLFTNICPSASGKLQMAGICYTILGIISIGLEAGLMAKDTRE
jgi:hypothetical protein